MPDMKICEDFIRRIPKTDLHLHLDGSLRPATLIELARNADIHLPSFTEEGLMDLVFKPHYKDLPDYLQGFRYTVAALQTEENLERCAYELAQDNIAEGVRYIEVRFAPQLHAGPHMNIGQVVRAVDTGLARARDEFNRAAPDIPFEYGIILCAMRRFNRHMSPYFGNLLAVMEHVREKEVFAMASTELVRAAIVLRDEGAQVVGFDLAGEESGFPAVTHREAFQLAHRYFISTTVHAGEAYGPESIFQAITECYAKRIGHGTFLFEADAIQDPEIRNRERYVNSLKEFIATRRIPIEVCPSSNLQTLPHLNNNLKKHSLQRMLDESLAVTICTDNRLVSRTGVTAELKLAADELSIPPARFREIIIAGFKGSFYPAPYRRKRELVRAVIDEYDRIAADYD